MSGYLNVYDLIEGRAQSTQKIISFYNNYELVVQKSYADIHADVLMTAKKLSAQLVKDEVFFLSLPNSYEFLIVFLASLNAGVIPAPIASADSFSESEYFDYLEQMKVTTQIQKILVPESKRAELVRAGFEVVSIADVPVASGSVNNPQKPKLLSSELREKIAFVQFSSGSTSEPKGVLISHSALIENITLIRLSLELNEKAVFLSWVPFFHDLGLVGSLLTPLVTGFSVHILQPQDFLKSPQRFLEMTSDLKATLWAGPDSMYRILTKTLQHYRSEKKLDLSCLKICLSGSEPVLFDTYTHFKTAAGSFGWNLSSFVAGYGLAENVLAVSFAPLRSRVKTHEKNKREIVSCGKPTREIKVQILDENQKLMKDGLEGLIWIQSPSLCSGYLDKEEVFRSQSLGSWFFTGDVGFIKDDELYISGRHKDLIIFDSRRYYSVDLEQRIWNLIGHDKHVRKVAVVGKGLVGGNEAVNICIEWRDFFPPLSFRQRRDFRSKIIHNLKNQLKISDKDILYTGIKSLPKTTSGKLQRYLVRNQIAKHQIKHSLWNIFWRSWLFGWIR